MNEKRSIDELSADEKKRLDNLNKVETKLIKDGYEKHDLTVNALKANVLATVTALPLILILLLVYLSTGNGFVELVRNNYIPFYFVITLISAVVIHEPLHGITFATFAENHFKDVSYGFIVKTLNPYCACKSPLKKYQYILSMGMPCIVLGIIPGIIAILIGNPIPLLFGILQILGAGGDLLIIILVICHTSNKKNKLYYDHPTEVGVILFDK